MGRGADDILYGDEATHIQRTSEPDDPRTRKVPLFTTFLDGKTQIVDHFESWWSEQLRFDDPDECRGIIADLARTGKADWMQVEYRALDRDLLSEILETIPETERCTECLADIPVLGTGSWSNRHHKKSCFCFRS